MAQFPTTLNVPFTIESWDPNYQIAFANYLNAVVNDGDYRNDYLTQLPPEMRQQAMQYGQSISRPFDVASEQPNWVRGSNPIPTVTFPGGTPEQQNLAAFFRAYFGPKQ